MLVVDVGIGSLFLEDKGWFVFSFDGYGGMLEVFEKNDCF